MTSETDGLRIGGEFELTGRELLEPVKGARPTFGRAHELWVGTGREALLLAARDILRRGGSSHVWLPAFCCESLAQPFRQLGFQIDYYPLDERLQVPGAELPDARPGEVFVFVHYFGHRNTTLEQHAATLARQGVWVIEDCVQAGLTVDLGRAGHYVVASYRKLLPQPDGALLACDAPIIVSLPGADEEFVSQRAWGKLLRATDAPAAQFLQMFVNSERLLDEQVTPRRISWLSLELMSRTQLDSIAGRRRCNWLHLADRLQKLVGAGWVSLLCDQLRAGEVPLGMPITVASPMRDPLRAFLAENNVFSPVHWPLPHVPHEAPFDPVHALETTVLTLPVDQRMSVPHIERLAGLLEDFLGGNS